MPYEAAREKFMDHGPAYVVYESSYIVRAGSDIRTAAELDRPGIRVGAVEGMSASRTVAKSLRHASLALFPKAGDAVDQLAQGRE
jgi:polar amino acid transport system substrate-binding protein